MSNQTPHLPSLFITGTDTGVGKTVVTAMLVAAFRANGVAAAPFKPVAAGVRMLDGNESWPETAFQSGVADVEKLHGNEFWADTAFLAGAAGVDERDVGLYRLKKPLSPHLAAAAEDELIDITAITEKLRSLEQKYDAVLVEGAGGIMAPVSPSETFLDVASTLGLPLVVVASPRLGTLNHTLLTVDACRDRGLELAGLVINRVPSDPDEAERLNLAELGRLTGVPVLGLIPEMDVSVDGLQWDSINEYAAHLDLTGLVSSGPSGHARAIAADRDHVWHPFSPMLEYLDEKPHPLMIVEGKGSHLVDSEGRNFIDGTGSLWVNIHGHRRPELDQAIKQQLNRVAHTTLLGLANEPSALLAGELAKITPDGLDRVFFSDNGSTAVEVALKVAFQYWKQSGHPEKKEFVSFVNAYHGDTIGAVSVGGHEMFHTIFEPLLFKTHLAPAAYCYRCPVGLAHPGCGLACLDGLEAILADRAGSVAAVIVEPLVQGAAGILVQPPGYLARIARLSREHGVLLIADEVATGFGRTGTLFACEQEDVRPDIMALAKGITGGYLPLAATLFREEIYEAFLGRFEEFRTFFHGHTYTGNPLACAAALANIELLTQPEFINSLEQKAALLGSLLEPLNQLQHMGDIRQLGMMAGIELVADRRSREPFPVEARMARRVILKAREQGVIIRPLGDTVVLVPPLAIDADDLRRLVDATAWAIKEVTEQENG